MPPPASAVRHAAKPYGAKPPWSVRRPEWVPDRKSATIVTTGTTTLNTDTRLLRRANIRTANQFSAVSSTLSAEATPRPDAVSLPPS